MSYLRGRSKEKEETAEEVVNVFVCVIYHIFQFSHSPVLQAELNQRDTCLPDSMYYQKKEEEALFVVAVSHRKVQD